MSDEKKRSEKGPDALERLLSIRSPARRPPSQGGGVTPVDTLNLKPELQQTLDMLIRQDMCTAIQVAVSLRTDLRHAQEILKNLVARGYIRMVEVNGQETFKLIWGRHRRPRLSSGLWETLQQDDDDR